MCEYPFTMCEIPTASFVSTIYNCIREKNPDLSETFLRCLPDNVNVHTAQMVILDAICDEYASVDAIGDLYESLKLPDADWIERFRWEFLGILAISHFKTEQILHSIQNVSAWSIGNGK